MRLIHRVISLVSEKNRREDISKEFFSANVEFEFFNAILGADIDTALYRKASTPYHRELTAGEVGCYLSHIENMRRFLETDSEFMAVYEDDVCLTESFGEKINRVVDAFVLGDVDILLTGYRNGYLSFWGGRRFGGVVMKRFCDYGWGAHAYVVSKSSARKILQDFSTPQLPFDCVTGGYTLNYKVWSDIKYKIYACHDQLVKLSEENSKVSTIVDRKGPSTYVKEGLYYEAVRFIKRVIPVAKY